jgi:probable O-glycosylation ligase (exosortase A-associated)
MRGIWFPVLFFALCALVPAAPYAGVLIWAWISMMNPHQLAGGWIGDFPVNMVDIAILGGAAVLHQEPLFRRPTALVGVIIVFTLWCLLTTTTALVPSITAARADLAIKSIILGVVVASTTTNQVRLRAFVWIFVLSYGYFGVKGGGFTIISGGGGRVVGPDNSTIADNNALALVLLMTIPLANYLRSTAGHALVRLGLAAAMLLMGTAVLGTYSRGGMIGLAVLSLYFWLVSPRKVIVGIVGVAAILAVLSVLPEQWFDRMQSVEAADQDTSFQGRVDAWRFAWRAASDRVTGVGFSGTEDTDLFEHYTWPNAVATLGHGRAAHSIYFEVMGDHGFIGLFFFVLILILAWRTTGRLAKARGPDVAWITEFGRMARVSLFTYCIAGAALSMAYDTSIFCLLGLLSAAHRLLPADAEAGARRPFELRSGRLAQLRQPAFGRARRTSEREPVAARRPIQARGLPQTQQS